MPIEKHSNDACLAESAPSVLAQLKTPFEADILRYTLKQKIEGYRQQIAVSELALAKQRDRRDDLIRQLTEEEAKGPVRAACNVRGAAN